MSRDVRGEVACTSLFFIFFKMLILIACYTFFVNFDVVKHKRKQKCFTHNQ